MRRTMVLVAVGATTLVAAILLWELRQVLLLFALALAIAAAARPLIDALVARGVGRVPALLGVYVIVVAFAAVAAYFLGVELGGELQRAGDQLLVAYERLRSTQLVAGGLRARVANLLPSIDTLSSGLAGARNVAGGAASATMSFVELLGQIVLVLVLAIYWDAYRQEALRFWLGLMRPGRRRRVREVWIATLSNVGEQLRSELGQSLVTLGACALIFRSLGMSYWVLPSLVVAVTRLFPFVGVLFGAAAAALAGSVHGALHACLASAVVVSVHIVLEYLVARRLLHRKPSNPVILILAAMVLVDAYGLAGLVLAPLATAAIQPVLESALAMRASAHPTPARDLGELSTRLDALKAKCEGEAATPEVQNLVTRLETLVTSAVTATAES